MRAGWTGEEWWVRGVCAHVHAAGCTGLHSTARLAATTEADAVCDGGDRVRHNTPDAPINTHSPVLLLAVHTCGFVPWMLAASTSVRFAMALQVPASAAAAAESHCSAPVRHRCGHNCLCTRS